MTQIERLAMLLEQNLGMTQHHLADFSDEDMLARPTPDANHAAWQLGHLIVAEVGMFNKAWPGALPELPADFVGKFTSDTAKVDDAKAFPAKAELLDRFAQVRGQTVKWVRTLKESDLDKETPERMRPFASNLGHLIAMTPVHVAMHLGQFQVIRRKLGKPVMF